MSSKVGQTNMEGNSLDALAATSSQVAPATESADSQGSGAAAPEQPSPLNVSATGTITATGEMHVGTSETLPVSSVSIPSEKKPEDKSASVGPESSEGLGKVSTGAEVSKATPLSQGSERGRKIPENGTSLASSNTGLKSVDRVFDYPIVRRGYGIYLQAQEYSVIAMPLRLVKGFAAVVCFPASIVATTLAGFCSLPISFGDYLLGRGLDVTETVFPCISVPPNQMIPVTRDCMVNCVCYCPRAAMRGLKAVSSYGKES